MITNDEQLQQAHEALGDLYQALASDRAKILPINPRNYVIMTQGLVEKIRKLQREIDAYLGLREESQSHHAATGDEVSALREEPPLA